ncbi:hypothetical protein [Photobacterium kishitanii]|uniref:Uncharacterized protein n=1 Tax=Photobacterium kishitanii TaxID=318456 RepID=A0A2T3KL46_9GAMM|nr:hypothetical protein [Photobacterium kishitanii]PSV00379.1 hypothetical protein C9J27_04425 [Photobacterium kishitanii]
MAKQNKTLKKLKALGVDIDQLPISVQGCAYEICTGVGLSSTLEIGFIISEDIALIQDLSKVMPALKIATSKLELFELKNKTGEEHVGFTHIHPYWEDNVFYCLYALPAKYAHDNLVAARGIK